jgi:hypothetical protein
MSKTPWPAIRTLARLELRRRWRAVLSVGLAGAALAGGTAAVATLQWRTDSAYPRLVERSGLEDVQALFVPQFTRPADEAATVRATRANADRLAARPEAAEVNRVGLYLGQLGGPGVQYVAVAAPRTSGASVGRPVLVRGRMPDPARTDEAIIEEGRATAANLRVGDRMPLDLLATRQFLQFSTGIGRPAGGHVELRIVGVFRYPAPARLYNSLVASPAFARAHDGVAVGESLLLRTRDAAAARAFTGPAARINDEMTARFGAGQQPYVELQFPRAEPDPALGPTRTVLRSGLLALAAVVLGAGLVLAFQVAGRWAERGREDQQVEAVLGLRTRERVGARLLAALPALALAAAGGVLGSLLAARAEPLGALRRYEPQPGWLPNPEITALAGVGAVVVVAGATVLATAAVTRSPRRWARAERGRAPRPRPGLYRLARGLGSRRGGPGTAMPTRSVVAALTTVVALTVVVADLHRQLAGISGQPSRWGWTAAFQVVDDTPAVDRLLARDPRVRDLEQLTSTTLPVRAGGSSAQLVAYGRATLRGSLPWTLAAGRVPRAAGEIALGPRAAHDLGVTLGDRVTVSGAHGPVALRVVGVAVLPTGNREPLGRNVLLTKAQLARLTATPPYSAVAVRASDPAAARALATEYGRAHELETPRPPETITALDELGTPTRILLGVLVLGLLLLIGQAARLLHRRRARQLAIARVLGVPDTTAGTAAVAALVALTGAAALVGAPLGWSVSRIVLAEIGPRLGLALAGPDGWPALLAVGAVAGGTVLVATAATLATLARLRSTSPRD